MFAVIMCILPSHAFGDFVGSTVEVIMAAMAPTPTMALFVRAEWCEKILHNKKRWEVRGYNTRKRGTYYLAQTGANLLVGTFTLKDSFKIATQTDDGSWQPVDGQMETFAGNEANYETMGFRLEDLPDFMSKYKTLWAWEISDVAILDPPKPWKPTQGAQLFCRVNMSEEATPKRRRQEH